MNDEKTLCEVTGCKTRWIPTGNAPGKQKGHHIRGLGVTWVNDRNGDGRLICAEHYLQGLVAAGKHGKQSLVDADGRYDADKVRAHLADIDAKAQAVASKPVICEFTAPAIEHHETLAITDDSEPSWLWEHE